MLTEAQARAREYRTTASQATVIMSGNDEAILRLWRERIGEIEPENLSHNWAVQLGSYLETFILDWHERKTGKELTDRGTFYSHPSIPDIGATLDGYRPADDCVVEVKVASAWQQLDDLIGHYSAQVICQMRCRQAANGALLICHGGGEPREIAVIPDPDYETELWTRLAAFELCVKTLSPPSPLPRIVPPEKWRTINLNDTAEPWPNWAAEVAFGLDQWRDVRPMALQFEDITARIKGLLPDDVGVLRYTGMTIRRNRRGAITIQDAAR